MSIRIIIVESGKKAEQELVAEVFASKDAVLEFIHGRLGEDFDQCSECQDWFAELQDGDEELCRDCALHASDD